MTQANPNTYWKKPLGKKELLPQLEDQKDAWVTGFGIGLALALKNLDYSSKTSLRSVKSMLVTSNLTSILNFYRKWKQDLKAEVKAVWSKGPDGYLASKLTTLK
jgi:hypothetical protein